MKPMKRVIVIGLDGFEPRIVEPMLAAGELPHLARLREQGGYARVATTYPAQTPVAWSTFATGTNPGGHGIFDFIRRDPKTYLPDYSLTRYEQKSPHLPPRAVNLRRGTPLWELLSAAGIASSIVRCPCTFPPDNLRGHMLAGMGVPDLRGGQGTSTLYTSREGTAAQESEKVVSVRANASGAVVTHIIGPRNPRTRADFEFAITIHPEPAARKIVIRSEGEPKVMELREGQWSDWLRVKFKTGFLQSVMGIVRFHLVSVEPVFELYASPVNFAPDAPLFPISAPPEYAGELARKLGTFYTTGMVEDHSGLNNGRLSEAAYLEQCEDVLREREQMMLYELQRPDEGLFFCLFDTPDRIQHMFWRFRENGAGRASTDLARVIEEHYRACDAVVGRALAFADDDTLFMALSDHGMSSFRRGVHLNSWLHENGLLALRPGVTPGEAAGDFFRGVEWERTRAYALGLGGIYLNLKGREAKGCVDPGEAAALAASIAKGLASLRDPANGAVAIRGAVTREQVYSGPYAAESPDLIVNFAEGYRVSWGTALGGVPEGTFEDNERKWAGDHVIDPCLVSGALFMNRKFRTQEARLLDMAPTILEALGVPKGAAMEGGSLLIS
jgi:predicted AlkP superfamily phosphohydrolase/phosphomutase